MHYLLRRSSRGQIFSNIHQNLSLVMNINCYKLRWNWTCGLDFYNRLSLSLTHTHMRTLSYIYIYIYIYILDWCTRSEMHPQSVWLLFGGQAKESAPPSLSLSLSFFEQNPLLLFFFTVSFLALKLQKWMPQQCAFCLAIFSDRLPFQLNTKTLSLNW